MSKPRPLKAIRKKCLDCCSGSFKEVSLCPSEDCQLYQLRFGKRVAGINPTRAMRYKCYDCIGGDAAVGAGRSFIRACGVSQCSLYKYRLGKMPRASLSAESITNTRGLPLP